MRAVIQRVARASVAVDNTIIAEIGPGLLIFLGIEAADSESDAVWLSQKIAKMRLFDDEVRKPNLDLAAIDGQALVVSQFTLHASTKKGNRPSFIKAAPPAHAEPLYLRFSQLLSEHLGKAVPTGKFGAHMNVALVNDGPVTILIDSQRRE